MSIQIRFNDGSIIDVNSMRDVYNYPIDTICKISFALLTGERVIIHPNEDGLFVYSYASSYVINVWNKETQVKS